MSSFNKIILLGNLTRDPQVSYLPSGTAAVEFGLATNRSWTSADGQKRDETCFIDCRIYGKRAEVIQRYFKKGSAILVEGRLSFDSWTAQDGSKRSKHRVSIDNFEFVGSAGGQNSQSQGSQGGYNNQAPQGGGGYNNQAPQGGGGYNQAPQGGYNQGNQNTPPATPPVAEPGNGMPMSDDSFDPDDIPF